MSLQLAAERSGASSRETSGDHTVRRSAVAAAQAAAPRSCYGRHGGATLDPHSLTRGDASMRYNRISADCHIDLPWLPPDLFTANASAAMKDRMPYVTDGPDGLRWTTIALA